MTHADRLPARLFFTCAILYAVLTLAFLGDKPITRTQEARVLETSRQMLESPNWHGWLVPKLNGEPRLRKPPLCYWYTAAAYKAFGVSEGAGRLPPLLIGWATIAVTYCFGRDLLGRRGGLLAAAALASSHFFIRFIRSDETDIPAMFGVTLACWSLWRGQARGVRGQVETERQAPLAGSDDASSLTPDPSRLSPLFPHLAALGIAIAAMSKGPPAIFPLVFLALLCRAVRSRAPAVRFLMSGAPLTAFVLILPWYAYAFTDSAAKQVTDELIVVTSGSNHRGLFVNYFPVILQMLLPWTPVFIAAFFAKPLRRTPIDLPGRVAACVVLGVFLPLCVTLNVQAHYLLPTLPGFALVIAWTLTRALEAIERGNVPLEGAVVRAVEIYSIVFVVAAIALVVLQLSRHRLGAMDVFAAAALGVAGFALWIVGRHREPSIGVLTFAACTVIVMPIVGGWWAPRFNPDHGREAAATIRERFADRPLIGWGSAADITLSFNLRKAIPWLTDAASLRSRLAEEPDAVVVTQLDERGGAPVPEIGLHKMFDLRVDKDELLFFESGPNSPSTTATTNPAK